MMPQEEMLGRVRTFAQAQMPALSDAGTVLAASGGADSCAMVALLCDAGLVDRSRAVVAHFDHRLRCEDASARDLAAVRALCERSGLPLVTCAWGTPMPGEAAARDARYRFLAAVASERGAAFVVTGHTADDQAETVLMHALRGAGLHGLAGMTPLSSLPIPDADGVRIARPLLCVTHKEARAYCEALNVEWSEDASNDDPTYARNRIRHELLPRLEEQTRGAREALLTMSRDARALTTLLDSIVEHVLPEASGRAATDDVVLDRGALRALPAVLAPYAWRAAVVRVLGDARDFGRKHFETLAAVADARTGAMYEFPRGVVATVDASTITLSHGRLETNAIASDLEIALPFEGNVGNWWVDARQAFGSGVETCWAPRGAVIRRRRPGDRMRLVGGGHKKLQDDFVDRRVPRRERDVVPLIAVGGDVLWTPFRTAAPAPNGGLVPITVSARRIRAT